MKEIITSRQNPQVRWVCSLADKKRRKQSGMFRFDGIKLLREAIRFCADIEAVFLRDPVSFEVNELISEGIRKGVIDEEKVIQVSDSVFEKISEESSPEGIVTVSRVLSELHSYAEPCNIHEQIKVTDRLLIAESLRDPGNLGTIMRSCAALGIDKLILSSDSAELYNSKTVRAAMGALFRLRTITVDHNKMSTLVSVLREGGRRVFAAALCDGAEKIGDMSLRSGDCFVIGNEGHGISSDVIAACDGTAIIPMTEGSESLNAAAAAAICVWETVKAR